MSWHIDLQNLNSSSVKLKRESLDELLAGGRLFYEIRLFDTKYRAITNLYFQGAIEFSNDFSKNGGSYFWVYFSLSILILIVISIIIYAITCYLKGKKINIFANLKPKVKENKIEDQNMKEIMLK